MTPNDFRRLALALPGTVEASHMSHPDFRVYNRIFATLGYPDETCATVKLKPDQQTILVATQSHIFRPVKGAWGLRGSTNVTLDKADRASIENALSLAWRNLAPRRASQPSAGAKPIATAGRTKRKST